MFRKNDAQQISLNDSYLALPEFVRHIVDKSWAKDFDSSVKSLETAMTLQYIDDIVLIQYNILYILVCKMPFDTRIMIMNL